MPTVTTPTRRRCVVCADWPGGEPIAIVPLMHRHEVEPGDALIHTTMRHEAGADLTPVEPAATAIFFGASYHADYATILGAAADLPAIAAAVADHLADTGGRTALGRGRPPAAALRRPGRGRAGGGLRWPGDRRGLDAQRGARGRLSGRPPAGRRDDGRLPRDARQEGAPRDPAQGPPGRGRRRGAPRGFGRSARRPRRVHRPAPEALGRRTASSPTRPAGRRAASSSAGCSSSPGPRARG